MFVFIEIYYSMIFFSQQEIHKPLFFVYRNSVTGNLSLHLKHRIIGRSMIVCEILVTFSSVILFNLSIDLTPYGTDTAVILPTGK